MSTVMQAIFGSRSARPHQHRDDLYGAAAGLRQERQEPNRLRREARRTFIRARSQARRDGRQLLKLLDHRPPA